MLLDRSVEFFSKCHNRDGLSACSGKRHPLPIVATGSRDMCPMFACQSQIDLVANSKSLAKENRNIERYVQRIVRLSIATSEKNRRVTK